MAKPVIAKRTAKHVISGKVQNWDHKIFTIQKVAASEQGIVVQFGRRVEYKVVKLTTKDLPPKDTDGTKITWINNFAVMDSRDHPVNRVHYTVFLPTPRRKDATFVYYDHRGLRRDKKLKRSGSKPAQDGMLQVDFHTGDPGVGCK